MELRPCPFCGSNRLDADMSLYIECLDCQAYGPSRLVHEPDGSASWNRRAPDPLREALLWFYVATRHDGLVCPELSDCCRQAYRIQTAAAAEVERLLGEMT